MPATSRIVQRILVAEDDPQIRSYLALALKLQDCETEFASDYREAIAQIAERPGAFDLFLLGAPASMEEGIEALRNINHICPGLPVIMLSATGSPSEVVLALRNGASDFLSKPIDHEDLRCAVKRALTADGAQAHWTHRESSWPSGSRPFYAATGPWPRRVASLLSQAGRSDAPLLLRGETGVGKEVLAREFHAVSPRAHHPFLKLNCAALPPDLVESELFGYERGAFSGAFQSTPGKFAMAAGGTVLLDEIGDMDLRLQAKLLQVVQDKEFIRLGSKQTTQVDVRVMAATHRDLERAIADGTFREDLFYRLNIIDIYIPPLRERRGEILGLAVFFLRKHSGSQEPPEIPPLLQDALLEHDWPGNVRELENVMRKLLVLRNAECLAEDLRSRLRRKTPVVLSAGASTVPHEIPKALGIAVTSSEVLGGSGSAPSSPAGKWNASGAEIRPKSALAQAHDARNAAEAQAIVTALSSTHWNRKRAAAVLQIEYKALLYKMKKLGIGTKGIEGHRQSNGRAEEPESPNASHACA